MNNLGLDPLIYSNEGDYRGQRFFLCGFFAFLTVVFLGLGIFLGFQTGEWWVMYFLGPIAIILAVISFGFFPRQKDNFYKMMVYEDRIIQQWAVEGSNDIKERIILFADVSDVVIGIVSRPISGPREEPLFHYNALLILNHHDGQFKQEVLSEDELYEWRRRLHNKIDSIHYAKEGLSNDSQTPINIEALTFSEDNIIGKFVGTEHKEPFQSINKIKQKETF